MHVAVSASGAVLAVLTIVDGQRLGGSVRIGELDRGHAARLGDALDGDARAVLSVRAHVALGDGRGRVGVGGLDPQPLASGDGGGHRLRPARGLRARACARAVLNLGYGYRGAVLPCGALNLAHVLPRVTVPHVEVTSDDVGVTEVTSRVSRLQLSNGVVAAEDGNACTVSTIGPCVALCVCRRTSAVRVGGGCADPHPLARWY